MKFTTVRISIRNYNDLYAIKARLDEIEIKKSKDKFKGHTIDDAISYVLNPNWQRE